MSITPTQFFTLTSPALFILSIFGGIIVGCFITAIQRRKVLRLLREYSKQFGKVATNCLLQKFEQECVSIPHAIKILEAELSNIAKEEK